MKPYETTEEGLENLKKELDELKNVRRLDISKRIATAIEKGDLSENAEYHDAKEAQGFLEGRVLEIQSYISNAVIVKPDSTDSITLGCQVLCKVNGKERTYQLVGSNESDPAAGNISNESPLGKALIGKKRGESFDFEAPSGTISYKIVDITC